MCASFSGRTASIEEHWRRDILNRNNLEALQGWAIPTATDIAFALRVLSLFGSRVPASLKIFLAALAIIDDLGAVIVIAVFYTADMNLMPLAGAALVWGNLFIFSKMKVKALWPYLLLGAVLWVLVFASGVHAGQRGPLIIRTRR